MIRIGNANKHIEPNSVQNPEWIFYNFKHAQNY